MAVIASNYNFIVEYAGAVNAVLDARQRLKACIERDAASKIGGGPGIVVGLLPTDFVDQYAALGPADILAAAAVMGEIEGLLTDYTANPPKPKPELAALLKFRP